MKRKLRIVGSLVFFAVTCIAFAVSLRRASPFHAGALFVLSAWTVHVVFLVLEGEETPRAPAVLPELFAPVQPARARRKTGAVTVTAEAASRPEGGE